MLLTSPTSSLISELSRSSFSLDIVPNFCIALGVYSGGRERVKEEKEERSKGVRISCAYSSPAPSPHQPYPLTSPSTPPHLPSHAHSSPQPHLHISPAPPLISPAPPTHLPSPAHSSPQTRPSSPQPCPLTSSLASLLFLSLSRPRVTLRSRSRTSISRYSRKFSSNPSLPRRSDVS